MVVHPTKFDDFKSCSLEVVFPPKKGGEFVFPHWAVVPVRVPGIDVLPVKSLLPANVDSVAVPIEFGNLVRHTKPQLRVVHKAPAALSTDEDASPKCVSVIIPLPHLQSVFLRLLRLGRSCVDMPVTRLRVKLRELKALWETAQTMEPSFSGVLKGKEPRKPKELNALLRQFRDTMLQSQSL